MDRVSNPAHRRISELPLGDRDSIGENVAVMCLGSHITVQCARFYGPNKMNVFGYPRMDETSGASGHVLCGLQGDCPVLARVILSVARWLTAREVVTNSATASDCHLTMD